jgi:hypothetical protein
METVKQFHELIEEAPGYAKGIAELANWSTNYDYQTGTPFLAFIDLIGLSYELYGIKSNCAEFVIDHVSAESFADAINEWSVRPLDCEEFITQLLQAD